MAAAALESKVSIECVKERFEYDQKQAEAMSIQAAKPAAQIIFIKPNLNMPS